MENYKKGRENTIREILTYVHEHKVLPQEAYDWDAAAIVKECVDNGFLENVKTVTCKDGHVRIDAARPYVTEAGLAFLCPTPYEETPEGRHEQLLKNISESTEELKRIADAAEKRAILAEKEAKSAKKDALFSKIISIVSIVITLISLFMEHLPQITSWIAR